MIAVHSGACGRLFDFEPKSPGFDSRTGLPGFLLRQENQGIASWLSSLESPIGPRPLQVSPPVWIMARPSPLNCKNNEDRVFAHRKTAAKATVGDIAWAFREF